MSQMGLVKSPTVRIQKESFWFIHMSSLSPLCLFLFPFDWSGNPPDSPFTNEFPVQHHQRHLTYHHRTSSRPANESESEWQGHLHNTTSDFIKPQRRVTMKSNCKWQVVWSGRPSLGHLLTSALLWVIVAGLVTVANPPEPTPPT